jgi:hypothetical protein
VKFEIISFRSLENGLLKSTVNFDRGRFQGKSFLIGRDTDATQTGNFLKKQ